jgi:signal recognition particle subunit SEC65
MKKMEIATYLENIAILKDLLSKISPDAEIIIPDIVVHIPIKPPLDEIAKQLNFKIKVVLDKTNPPKSYKAIVIHLRKQDDFSKLAFNLDKLLDAAQNFVKKNPFDFSTKSTMEKEKGKK